MEHFDGTLTPEFAWKNDMLNEQRRTNELLEQLIAQNQTQGGEAHESRSKRTARSIRNAQ